jgi:hypothetical protein
VSRPEQGGTPRLVYDADPPQRAAAPDPERPRRGRALPVVLAVLLVAFAAAALAEYRRASRLENRVVELDAALGRAQAEISARRAQLDAIRSSVGELRERVGALEALAVAEPEAAAPPAR